jgi:nickel transport protein
MTIKHTLLSGAAALLVTATVADAHASWIAQYGGDYVVIHGEGSATNEAYDPSIVTDAKGFDKTGAPLPVTLAPRGKVMGLGGTENATVLSVVYSEGWWTEDAAGEWHNDGPENHAGYKSTAQYFTYPVAYVAATEKPGIAIGHPLEIVPLTDPTVLTMGDKLQVQVLKDGKPLVGVSVSLDVLTDWDLSSPVTDAEGKTMITVQNNGMNVLQYYDETKVSEKESLGLQAVLSFVAKGPAEE